MNRLIVGIFLGTILATGSAAAAQKLPDTEKILLQAAMQKSISRQLVDGRYFYFDEANARVVTIFPDRAHPIMLRMGEHFILCADFRDANGKAVNIDFYIARRGGNFVVFDTVVDNRKPIERLMKTGRVSRLK